jgi:hypothetical protein
MRIYEVNIEHKKAGLNWRSEKVAANTAEEAIKKIKFESFERLESIELLASTD